MEQSLSNNTNNFSSLGAEISEHRRMKKSTFVFTVVPIICFAVGIFFFIAGFWTNGSIKESVSSLILALIFFACGVPLWVIARRERDLLLRTFTDGLSYRRNHQEMAARWGDVENVYENIETRSVNGVPAGTFYKYTIELKDGKKIRTSERLAEMENFSRTIRAQLFPRLFVEAVEHYKSGADVKFGEITINKSGIGYRQKLLSWNSLRETQMINGHLKIIGADGNKAWATVLLAKIPNNFVLTALLDDIFKG
jgi:hypothetical protein